MDRFILILILSITPFCVFAETYYVDDTLRVGVRAKPVKSLPSLTVIRSGDKVELLEKSGSYAKVRTSNGTEGWVKSAYLSSKPPAIAKLKTQEAELSDLKAQLNNVNSGQADAQKESSILKAQVAKLKKENEALEVKVNEIARNHVENPVVVQEGSFAPNIKAMDMELLYFALGAVLVLLSLGFVFGVSWHKKQVTKRLGGLSL